MTAIFAIWNNYGFSLASDSNQTAFKDNQTWVDPVEKIIMLEKHQIAIGAAGDSTYSGVEINEIFRTWERLLPDDGFSELSDYFAHFANWLSNQSFARENMNYAGIQDLFRSCFERIKSVMGENSPLHLSEAISREVVNSYNPERDGLNFYGPDWELYSSIADESRGSEPPTDGNFDVLREKLLNLNPGIAHSTWFGNNDSEIDEDVVEQVIPVFEEIFHKEFDSESEIDLEILGLAIDLISNLSYDKNENLEILFVGYGSLDWKPYGISFKLFSNFFGLRRLQLTKYSNPDINWYMSIAIDKAIEELTHGISSDRVMDITEIASHYIDTSQLEEFSGKINKQSNDRFHKSLAKIDYVTIDRLEFLSKLFVQIEALKSFLDQPVPGVGGDIKVITMTKTTKRQKHFRELDN
jgi:hypothetical protein